MVEILSLGNINISVLEKEFGKLQTSEIIVTGERIAHIRERHFIDYNLNVISKLALDTDKSGLKNSVMTFYRIRERNLKKLITKNTLLYKKE